MGVGFPGSHRALRLCSCYALTILESLREVLSSLFFSFNWVLVPSPSFLPSPALVLLWIEHQGLPGPSRATHVWNSGATQEMAETPPGVHPDLASKFQGIFPLDDTWTCFNWKLFEIGF